MGWMIDGGLRTTCWAVLFAATAATAATAASAASANTASVHAGHGGVLACDGLLGQIDQKLSGRGGGVSPLNDIVDVTRNEWVSGLRDCARDRANPQRAMVYYRLGQLLAFKGKRYHGEAIGAYQRALEIGGWRDGGAGIRKRLASLYRVTKRWDDYIRLTNQMLQSDPNMRADWAFHSRRGRAFEAITSLDQAYLAYSKAAELGYQAGLEGNLERSADAESADRVRRAGLGGACQILDPDSKLKTTRTMIARCLKEKRLPQMDRALLLIKRAQIYQDERNMAAASRDYAALFNLKPMPPTARQMDLDHLRYARAETGNSIAQSYLASYIMAQKPITPGGSPVGNGDPIGPLIDRMVDDYEAHLALATQPKSGYQRYYDWTERSTPNRAFYRPWFTGLALRMFAAGGMHAQGLDLIDYELRRPGISGNQQVELVMGRASLQHNAGAFDDSLKTLVELEDALTRASVNKGPIVADIYRLRALSYTKLSRFGEALAALDRWFGEGPSDWASKASDVRQHVELEVLRGELAVKIGDRTRARQSITALETAFTRFQQDCTPCAELEAALIDGSRNEGSKPLESGSI